MPKVEDFLHAVTEIQLAEGDAVGLLDPMRVAIHALAELLHLGFLTEAAEEHRLENLSGHIKQWSEHARKWGLEMVARYKDLHQTVKDTDVHDAKEIIANGHTILPANHKAIPHLNKAQQILGR